MIKIILHPTSNSINDTPLDDLLHNIRPICDSWITEL